MVPIPHTGLIVARIHVGPVLDRVRGRQRLLEVAGGLNKKYVDL